MKRTETEKERVNAHAVDVEEGRRHDVRREDYYLKKTKIHLTFNIKCDLGS